LLADRPLFCLEGLALLIATLASRAATFAAPLAFIALLPCFYCLAIKSRL